MGAGGVTTECSQGSCPACWSGAPLHPLGRTTSGSVIGHCPKEGVPVDFIVCEPSTRPWRQPGRRLQKVIQGLVSPTNLDFPPRKCKHASRSP